MSPPGKGRNLPYRPWYCSIFTATASFCCADNLNKVIQGVENHFLLNFYLGPGVPELFPSYDRQDPHWTFIGENIQKMMDRIPKGASVLDTGAGECKYSNLFEHAHYVSTDLVSSSNKHDFTLIDVVADASSLPFKDKSFDVALNLVVIEHVPSPMDAVSEMARVLKPGGLAFALIPLVRPEHLAPFDYQRLTRYGVQRLFENNGFEIDSINGSNGSLWTAYTTHRL